MKEHNGPLQAIRDTHKVKQFVETIAKLKHNQSVKQAHLNKLMTKDLYQGQEGLSSPDERDDEHALESVSNNQLLYDIMKSKLSKNVHSVTSQHLAVG